MPDTASAHGARPHLASSTTRDVPDADAVTGEWVGLLRHVLDDDDRTRRADLLLSHLTLWLVVIATVVVVAVLLLLSTPYWVPTGAGGVGVVSAGLLWFRRWRRRSLPSA